MDLVIQPRQRLPGHYVLTIVPPVLVEHIRHNGQLTRCRLDQRSSGYRSHRLHATTLPSRCWALRVDAGADIKPHLIRGWLNRKDDPAFFDKAKAICDLYRHPPPGAVVLSVDEKTGIQAKSRKHPTRRAAPGRRERREFEYIRHGTVSLTAAMNIVTGQVLGQIITRNDSQAFCAFLALIDQAIPRHLDIYLVMDNGSSHTSKATKAWLAAHPRFRPVRTPAHASWLNMRSSFSILQRRLLRRGEFTSRTHLASKIIEFICNYDDTAKPFRWSYDGRPLKAA